MELDLPKGLKSGEIARLFPVIAETGKEQRASSIFLSVLSAVPPFANALLQQLGQKVGSRSKFDTFTEVVFEREAERGRKDRPDGMIRVQSGKNTWTCLVEAKIGSNLLEADQIEKYLRLARENEISGVLTISNQFASNPLHHPVAIQKNLLKKADLYHLSWSAILTEAVIMHEQSELEDVEQAFLIREFIRFFSHKSAGVTGFSAMPKAWSAAIENIQVGGQLNKSDGMEIIAAWHQETRNLALIMSRIISCRVEVKLARAHRSDKEKRILDDLRSLCEKNCLIVELEVPNAASPIHIEANLNSRTIIISMTVSAPKDRQRNTAKLNWLLKQLKSVDRPDVYIGTLWAGRSGKTVHLLTEIKSDPKKIDDNMQGSTIRAFEVTMTSTSARRFTGVRTFIEEIELLAPQFYEFVGQHLETWLPPPPKPKHSVSANDAKSVNEVQSEDDTKPMHEVQPDNATPFPGSGNMHAELLEIPTFLDRKVSETAPSSSGDDDSVDY